MQINVYNYIRMRISACLSIALNPLNCNTNKCQNIVYAVKKTMGIIWIWTKYLYTSFSKAFYNWFSAHHTQHVFLYCFHTKASEKNCLVKIVKWIIVLWTSKVSGIFFFFSQYFVFTSSRRFYFCRGKCHKVNVWNEFICQSVVIVVICNDSANDGNAISFTVFRLL